MNAFERKTTDQASLLAEYERRKAWETVLAEFPELPKDASLEAVVVAVVKCLKSTEFRTAVLEAKSLR